MDVVYASATARVTTPEGGTVMVRKGTHWPADDPIVAQSPSLFSDDPRYGLEFSRKPDGFDEPPVEQATAAPGERRATRRTR
jgi:hypothetical protein